MKKIFVLIAGIILFGISCAKPNDPEEVFNSWLQAAKKHNYTKMFKYETFLDLDNVIFSYETITKGKWSAISKMEKEKFINNYYKKAVKTALDNLTDKKYKALLRLEPDINLKIESYEVKGNEVKMWITGDFFSAELVKLKLYDNVWKLYNPLGYHSFIPTRKYIKEMMGIKEDDSSDMEKEKTNK